MKLSDSMRLVTEYLCNNGLLDDFIEFIESQGFTVQEVQLDQSVIEDHEQSSPGSESFIDTIWG